MMPEPIATPEVDQRFLVRYVDDPALLHERRVVAVGAASGGEAVIVTPDYDIYPMVLRAPPLAEIHPIEGRRGAVTLPPGVRRRDVYLFSDGAGEPDADQRQHHRQLGAAVLAKHLGQDQIRAHRRVTGKQSDPTPQAAVIVPVEDQRAGIADDDVEFAWVVAEHGGRHPLGAIIKPTSLTALVAGRALDTGTGLLLEMIPRAFVSSYRADWFTRTGLADPLATPRASGAVGGTGATAQLTDGPSLRQSDGLDGLRADLLGDKATKSTSLAGVADGADPAGDARVLPIARDSRGRRFRDFRSAVEALSESEWPDWPVTGPRTLLWCLNFIVQHFIHPDQRHMRWMSDAKLNYNDAGTTEHQSIMRIISYAVTYDQLDVTQLASLELVIRRAQMIELKYKDKVVPRPTSASDPFQDMHLYMGLSETRGLLMVAPSLEKYIGEELHREALAAKERRKAAEERAGAGGKK